MPNQVIIPKNYFFDSMSWSVFIKNDEGETLYSVNHIQYGGTQVVGGTNECDLNITYNYSKLFREVFPLDNDGNTTGLVWLEYKTGKESEQILAKAVERLGVRRDDDYWEATMGNAGFSLQILLSWAREFPNGRFSIC